MVAAVGPEFTSIPAVVVSQDLSTIVCQPTLVRDYVEHLHVKIRYMLIFTT